MVKKAKKVDTPVVEVEESESEIEDEEGEEEGEEEIESVPSGAEEEKEKEQEEPTEANIEKKFGQKGINDIEGLNTRLTEIKGNFYNRLDSAKLIKRQGKIPFTEHMCVSGDNLVEIPTELPVHNEIKREIAFYNVTRENVMKGMQFLVQSKVPISRPDDFFAEMYKSDAHMNGIKSRILKQQAKMQSFEEKKHRSENKKFHKAIKDHKMKEKHQEKRENLERIQTLKKKVQERGDDMDDAEFDKVMGKGK